MEKIIVGISEGKTARHGQLLVSYALGSCVGVCLYDVKIRIAGMAHLILPDRTYAVGQKNEYKFAADGTRKLLDEMCRHCLLYTSTADHAYVPYGWCCR